MITKFFHSLKLIPVLLVLLGLGISTLLLSLDLFGLGEPGIGPFEIFWATMGGVITLVGLFLCSSWGKKYLGSWRGRIERREVDERTTVRIAPLVLWFGMLTGLAEALILAYTKLVAQETIRMGDQFVWMAPVADVVIFAIPGLVLVLIAWRRPRLVSLFAATFVFAFLAFLSLLLHYPQIHAYASLLLALGLAYQTSRFIRAHPGSFYRLVRRTAVWMGAAVLVLGVGVNGWQWFKERRALANLPTARADAPNVLLIVMDTVRAGSMSLNGYSKRTTPYLESLGSKSVMFERALATSSWTLPSHASMFTGRNDLTLDRYKPVHLNQPTLAEFLSEQGYRTGGFVANLNYCTRERGLDRGFMHYEDFPLTLGQVVITSSLGGAITNNRYFRRLINYHDMLNDKDAERINADFLKWLEKDDRKPFFAFLNYYDAHEPYLPPQGFAGKFGPTGPRGNLKYLTNDIEREKKWTMSKEDVEIEEAAYEGSIAYLDYQISQLMKNLESRGILKNTLVIITSDHGEQFGERAELFGHGNSLYFSSLHVPLLFFFPSSVPAGKRISEPVSLRNIPSTVAQILGLGESGFFPGESLARLWDQSERTDRDQKPVLSELLGGSEGNLRSLVISRYHLIHNGDGGTELYDFESDPFELQNLANSDKAAQILNEFNDTGEVSAAINR